MLGLHLLVNRPHKRPQTLELGILVNLAQSRHRGLNFRVIHHCDNGGVHSGPSVVGHMGFARLGAPAVGEGKEGVAPDSQLIEHSVNTLGHRLIV